MHAPVAVAQESVDAGARRSVVEVGREVRYHDLARGQAEIQSHLDEVDVAIMDVRLRPFVDGRHRRQQVEGEQPALGSVLARADAVEEQPFVLFVQEHVVFSFQMNS